MRALLRCAPLVLALGCRTPARPTVTEAAYCRIMDGLADSVTAQVRTAAANPALSPERAREVLVGITPVGSRADLARAVGREGFTPVQVADFALGNREAVERCTARFTARLDAVQAQIETVGRVAARDGGDLVGPIVAASTPASAPTGATARSPRPRWREDADAALAEARARGRAVLLVFCADWSPACEELDHQTFADARVRAVLDAELLAIRVDLSDEQANPRGAALARARNVTGLPAQIVLDGAGGERGRIVGFVDADALLRALAPVRGTSP